MKEFVNKIQIQLNNNSESGVPIKLFVDDFKFMPTLENHNAGILYNCDLTLYLETPSEDVVSLLKREKTGVVTLFDSDMKGYNLGSDSIPAKIHLVEHLTKSTLFIKCYMIHNPLSS